MSFAYPNNKPLLNPWLMKMKSVLGILCLTLCLSAAAQANIWFKIFNLADNVADVASLGKTTDTKSNLKQANTLHNLDIVTADAAAAMSEQETTQLNQAWLDFLLRPGAHDVSADMDTLKTLSDLLSKTPTERSITYSDALPNLQIWTPNDSAYDTSLRDFAKARLQKLLDEPIDVQQLHIINFGQAKDTRQATQLARQLRKSLPRSVRDDVGPLTRRVNDMPKGYHSLLTALKPYQYSTVILVGEALPPGSERVDNVVGQFESIPLQPWFEAAKEAHVRLVSIASNTGFLAPVAEHASAKTLTLAERLRDVVKAKPTTLGQLLAHLTGNELQFQFNAVDPLLLSKGLAVTRRQSNATVGAVSLQGIHPGDDAPSTDSDLRFSSCFTASDTLRFDACVADKESQYQQQQALEKEKLNHAEHKAWLEGLPQKIAEAKQNHQQAQWECYLAGLLYTVVWLCAGFMIPHSVFIYQWARAIDAQPWTLLFSRELMRYSLEKIQDLLLNVLPFCLSLLVGFFSRSENADTEQREFEYMLLVPLLLGASVYFAQYSDVIKILLVLLAAYGIFVVLGLIWAALQSFSLTLFIPSLAFVLIILAAVHFVTTLEQVSTTQSALFDLQQPIIDAEQKINEC